MNANSKRIFFHKKITRICWQSFRKYLHHELSFLMTSTLSVAALLTKLHRHFFSSFSAVVTVLFSCNDHHGVQMYRKKRWIRTFFRWRSCFFLFNSQIFRYFSIIIILSTGCPLDSRFLTASNNSFGWMNATPTQYLRFMSNVVWWFL